MDYEMMKEKWSNTGKKDWIHFTDWFEMEVPDVRIRDYLRLQAAWGHALDAFSMLDSVEDDTLFENKLEELHIKLDKMSSEMNDIYGEVTEEIGKDLVNGYLSTLS